MISNDFYRSVLENALDAFVGMDSQGRVIEWNQQAEALFGWMREEAIGQSLSKLIIPEQLRTAHERGLQHCIATGESQILNRRIEITAQCRGGHELPVELTVTPVTVARTQHFYAFIRDLSAIKQAEDERAHSERLNTTINNNASLALFLMDDRQHCTYMNPAAERMTGFTLEEVQGAPLHEFIHHTRPDGRPYPIEQCPIDSAFPTRSRQQGEDVFVHKDGRFYPVAFTASPIVEGGVATGTVIEVQDISEEKRAQEEKEFLAEVGVVLSESLDLEETLHQVTHLAVPRLADLCLVRLHREDGTLEHVSLAYHDPAKEAWATELVRRHFSRPRLSFGSSAALLSGQSQLIPEYDEALVQATIATYPGFKPLLEDLQIRSLVAVPLTVHGRIIGTLTFAQGHYSGRRHDEKDMRLAEEFARRCALATENSRLFKKAREAIHLRDQFLSIASHELKTPLTALKIQIELLQRKAARSTEEASQKWLVPGLQRLERQNDRLSRLVSTLLDASRIARGNIRLELEQVDLSAIVREVVDYYKMQGELENIVQDIRVEAGHEVIGRWDRLRIEQIVSNVIDNALKYGAGNPVTVATTKVGDMAQLTVVDKGIGIAPDHHRRIFGKFERAVPLQHYGGLGLGLYVTHQIVEALGGDIELQSEPGQGTSLRVRLPVVGPSEGRDENKRR